VTLVVSKMLGGHALIVGDTRISWPTHGPNLPRRNMSARDIGKLQDGCLKNVIVHPDLCICWAGDLHFADEAFKSMPGGSDLHQREPIISHFLKWHQVSGGKTDFLIALRSDRESVFQISGGVASEVRDTAWIGSQEAFARFDRLVSGEERSSTAGNNRVEMMAFQLDDLKGRNCDPMLSAMTLALRSILYDDSFGDVGDFAIPVAGTGTGFRYFFYTSFDAPFAPPSVPDRWETVDLGNIDTGAYNFQLLEYHHVDTRFPILHFLQARYALSFSDRKKGVPRIEIHDSQSALVKSIEQGAQERKRALEHRQP